MVLRDERQRLELDAAHELVIDVDVVAAQVLWIVDIRGNCPRTVAPCPP